MRKIFIGLILFGSLLWGDVDHQRFLVRDHFYSIETSGQTVLAGGQEFLTVFHHDTESLTWITSVDLPGPCWDIEIYGSYAYLATDEAGITVVAMDGDNFPIVSNVVLPDRARALTLAYPNLYVACNESGIVTLDISSPADPAIVETLPLSGICRDVAVIDGVIYAACGAAGLFVLQDGAIHFNIPTQGYAVDIEYSGNRLFVADMYGGIIIFSIQSGTSPVLLHRVPSAYDIIDIELMDNTILATAYEGRLILMTMEGDTIQETPLTSHGYQSIAEGGMILCAQDRGGVSLYQCHNNEIVTQFTYPANSWITRVSEGSHLLYVTDSSGGIIGLDRSTLKKSFEVHLDSSLHGVAEDGDYLYVAAGRGGLVVLKGNEIVASLSTQGHCNAVVVRDHLAYLATGTGGMDIIDIHNPDNPTRVNYLDLPGDANAITLQGNRAYVSCGYEGTVVMDISNPDAPAATVILPTSCTSCYASGSYVHDGHLYITEGEGGLDIYTLNAAVPSLQSNVPAYSYFKDLVIRGNSLILTDILNGLLVYNLQDPSHPEEEDFYPLPGLPRHITLMNDTLLVTTGYSLEALTQRYSILSAKENIYTIDRP